MYISLLLWITQLSQPTQTQTKDRYFTSSTDLNSKFKNHRADEWTLCSMPFLPQCVTFAFQGTFALLVPSAWNTFPLALHILESFLPVKPQLQCHLGILPQASHTPHLWPSFWKGISIKGILFSPWLVSCLPPSSHNWNANPVGRSICLPRGFTLVSPAPWLTPHV